MAIKPYISFFLIVIFAASRMLFWEATPDLTHFLYAFWTAELATVAAGAVYHYLIQWLLYTT